MFHIKPLHYAVALSLFGFISNQSYADATACANNPTPATYNTTNRTVTIPELDVPLLEPITGNPTGEIAVFSAELQQMAGIDDFQLVGSKLVFSKFAPTFDPNHARYDFNDQIFSNGGKLNVCVSVPQIIIIPPNIQIPTEPKKFDVDLRQLAVDQATFHIVTVTKVETTTLPIPPSTGSTTTPSTGSTPIPATGCDDPTIRTQAQTQLLETFTLWTGIAPMVVVDYDSSGGIWANPLSWSVTVPTGTYTDTFVSGGTAGTYIDAIMKTKAQNPQVSSEIAGKSLRFIFNPTQRTWSCSANIPNGIPSSCLAMTTGGNFCDNPLL